MIALGEVGGDGKRSELYGQVVALYKKVNEVNVLSVISLWYSAPEAKHLAELREELDIFLKNENILNSK